MTKNDIEQQIQNASSIVGQWPRWKQNILNHSCQPTNSTARTPVDPKSTDMQQRYEPSSDLHTAR